MKSWKTTSAGALAIVSAITTLWFQRASLTPELITGAAAAILTGVGLLCARDNDKSSEDVGAKDPPATLPKTGPLLALSLAAGLALSSAGCSTTPSTAAYRTSATAKVSVDSAMRSWGNYVAQFHPPVSQEAAVRDAFKKYQLAQAAILDAAINYRTAQETGDAEGQTTAQNALSASVATASGALDDLVALIQSFGVKIQPPTTP